MVEFDPFYGYESETIVAHLTKLNDIATLVTNDERTRYFYILKIFLFSLKGDAKIWFNSLDPGCVRSPQDMVYYFSAKYFPAHKKQAAVAPRLRATGLPCIASPETMSSGNTQHGTENNRFIDASGTEFILQQLSRPSSTHGAAKQYVHYLVNIKGP